MSESDLSLAAPIGTAPLILPSIVNVSPRNGDRTGYRCMSLPRKTRRRVLLALSGLAWPLTTRLERLAEVMGVRYLLRRIYWRLFFHLAPLRSRRHAIAISPPLNEYPVFVDLFARLRFDDVAFDVGAHFGGYTLPLANVLSGEQVIAFEPHPKNVARLERRLNHYDLDATPLEYALSDRSGIADLRIGRIHASHRLTERGTGETIRVRSARGDELVENGCPTPTVLKIDAEGAELAVIRGLSDTLSTRVRLVYCEFHPTLHREPDRSRSELIDELTSLGFEVQQIHEHEGREYFRAESVRD